MSENVYIAIGKRIRAARLKAGLTQQDVADQLKLTNVGFGAFERGDGRYLGKGKGNCQPNMVKAEPIERQVYEYVLDVLANPGAYLDARKQRDNSADSTREMAEIAGELRQLELRKKRGFDAYDVGAISLDEYRQHRAAIDRRARELQARQLVLTADAARSHEFEALIARHAALLGEWQAAPVERWHELLVGIVREVIITRGSDTDIKLL